MRGKSGSIVSNVLFSGPPKFVRRFVRRAHRAEPRSSRRMPSASHDRMRDW